MARKQHPAAEAAKKFDEQMQAEQAEQAEQVEAQQAPEPEPQPPAAAAPAPEAPVIPAPTIDWEARAREAERYAEMVRRETEDRARELIEQRAQEAAQLAQRLKEAQETNLRLSSELDTINFERATQISYDGLEHIDPEVAKEMSEKMFRPMLQGIEQRLKSTYEQRIEELTRGMTERDERLRNDRNTRMNTKIRAAHPDVDKFANSQAFNDFRSMRVPGTRTTYGEQLAEAYNDGDAAFVVEILDAFVGSRPAAPSNALAAMAAAPSGGAASSVATQPAGQPVSYKYTELSEWQAARRRGDISREEFAKRMDAFKKAEAQGLVE